MLFMQHWGLDPFVARLFQVENPFLYMIKATEAINFFFYLIDFPQNITIKALTFDILGNHMTIGDKVLALRMQ